jgi:hypothetical protein
LRKLQSPWRKAKRAALKKTKIATQTRTPRLLRMEALIAPYMGGLNARRCITKERANPLMTVQPLSFTQPVGFRDDMLILHAIE